MATAIRRTRRDASSTTAPSEEEIAPRASRARREPRGSSHQIGEDETEQDRPRRRSTPADDAPERTKPARKANDGWGGTENIKKTSGGEYADDFKLKDDKQVLIKFLEDAPFDTFNQHWIERDGKKSFTCLEDDCPLCEVGDRPSAQVCFNIISLEKPEEPKVLRWRVGITVANLIKGLTTDKKTSPLSRDDLYFAVKRTVSGSGRGKKYSTAINPVKERDLDEDFDMDPLSEDDIDLLAKEAYTADSTEVQSFDDLSEIADEIAGD